MARTKIEINECMLKRIIQQCEAAKPYTARSALYEDVSSAYNLENRVNSTGLKDINQQLVYLRVKELNIDLKTPVGKRGRSAGCVINTGIKVPRADKIAKDKGAQVVLANLRKELKTKYINDNKDNSRFLPLVTKIEQGSMKAAIKLMCLQCSDYDTKEVAMCQCTTCPLHILRPYKNKQDLTERNPGV